MTHTGRAIDTTAIIFPFDSFGGGGTAAGSLLLGDALREVIDDTALERRKVRQKAFAERMNIVEAEFHTLGQLQDWRTTGHELFARHQSDFLLWLGGNHLSVLPVYDALDADTLVVQFDAHLDCYDLHDTTRELSHGNFLRHIEGERPRIVNVGHRDLFLSSREIRQHYEGAFAIDASWSDIACDAESIWIDIDADVFDPAFCPAVRQPQAAGLTPREILSVLNRIDFEKVRGVSICEFDPALDIHDSSLNLLGWFLEWLLLKKFNA